MLVNIFNGPAICTHLMPTFAGAIDMTILLATEALLRVPDVRSSFIMLKDNIYFLG